MNETSSGKSASPTNDGFFRKLAIATFSTTLLLILLGGIVRLSDSGLGCGPGGSGLKGWPLCGGRVLPILDTNLLVEYSHRALASLVGVLILTLVWFAWRRHREDVTVVRLTTTAAALVIGEGVLGGLTVEYDLSPLLVATHLGISMFILAALLGVVFASGARPAAAPVSLATRRLAAIASSLTWCTVVAGGYVAGTQKYGSANLHAGGGAHMACGKEFPTCNGSILPFGDSSAVNTLLVHQSLMYLTVIAVIWLAVSVLRGPAGAENRLFGPRMLAESALAVLLLQVLLGAMNLWFGEQRLLILAHLMLGTALWLVVFALAFDLFRSPKTPSSPKSQKLDASSS